MSTKIKKRGRPTKAELASREAADASASSSSSSSSKKASKKSTASTGSKKNKSEKKEKKEENGEKKHKPRRFRMIRSLHVADFVTLCNAASGVLAIFACLNSVANPTKAFYLSAAFVLLVFALAFDIADGSVARALKSNSAIGAELDSLSDVISFSLAPAVLAFTLGMRGGIDSAVLVFFVLCGIARLARFNVTASSLANPSNGKVSHFQGFPVPTSILLVLIMAGLRYYGQQLWLLDYPLTFPVPIIGSVVAHFHPFVLSFFVIGCLQISEFPIPKP